MPIAVAVTFKGIIEGFKRTRKLVRTNVGREKHFSRVNLSGRCSSVEREGVG